MTSDSTNALYLLKLWGMVPSRQDEHKSEVVIRSWSEAHLAVLLRVQDKVGLGFYVSG